jgi:hypothetical protein
MHPNISGKLKFNTKHRKHTVQINTNLKINLYNPIMPTRPIINNPQNRTPKAKLIVEYIWGFIHLMNEHKSKNSIKCTKILNDLN